MEALAKLVEAGICCACSAWFRGDWGGGYSVQVGVFSSGLIELELKFRDRLWGLEGL